MMSNVGIFRLPFVGEWIAAWFALALLGFCFSGCRLNLPAAKQPRRQRKGDDNPANLRGNQQRFA